MHSDKVRRAMADIVKHAELAIKFTAGKDLAEFIEGDMPYLAVVRCLEIVSEATRRLPDAIKLQYPHISWRQIADAGNFYRHVYDAIKPEYVLETTRDDLPVLILAIRDAMTGAD